jgi:hypothetical protein
MERSGMKAEAVKTAVVTRQEASVLMIGSEPT